MTEERFAAAWQEWHETVEARRADPDGFLAVTGLYWLDTTPIEVPDAPGRWSTSAAGPVVELGDASLTIDGDVVTGTHRFGPLDERGGITVGVDGGVVEVARRGGFDILRPRRRDHAFLAAYTGTPAYAADARWVVPARFVAHDVPQDVEVDGAAEGIRHVYTSPGALEFERGGDVHRLVVLPGHAPGTLEVIFTDATSGVTTYAANRRVAVAAPDADGRTTIDFTRAANFPCAYTDFATCPLPPAGNHLPFPVEAGERTPVSRVVGHPVPGGLGLALSA